MYKNVYKKFHKKKLAKSIEQNTFCKNFTKKHAKCIQQKNNKLKYMTHLRHEKQIYAKIR